MKAIEVKGHIKPGTIMAKMLLALFNPRTIDEICDRVWGEQSEYTARNTYVLMAELRKRGYSIKKQRPAPRKPLTYELVNEGDL